MLNDFAQNLITCFDEPTVTEQLMVQIFLSKLLLNESLYNNRSVNNKRTNRILASLGVFVKLFSSDNSTTDIINISALK